MPVAGKRLLVANRGEIAIRILRAGKELGMECLGLFSADEPQAAHLKHTDNAIGLKGHGPAAWLDIAHIIQEAKAHQVDMIHPGYGLLSENAAFARACEEAGIIFIGPKAETLDLFGDKGEAIALAKRCRVPVIPGCPAPASASEIAALFEQLPNNSAVMIKACLGGGGRGMRIVEDRNQVESAVADAQSEARKAFGDDRLYAEMLVPVARHIEVQVLADKDGDVMHAWDRDCSLQRRQQKVIEIAPASGIDPDIRKAMLDASLTLAKKAGLSGLATFEFLLTPENHWFFMECNPRLQVEHTITEEVTGLDLVASQIALAAGDSLSDLGLQTPAEPTNAAIQARITAEIMDDDGNLTASSGEIASLSLPSGPGIRLDHAIHPGFRPNPLFDSLVAKLIVSGRNMELAQHRLEQALQETQIQGLPVNTAFLQAIISATDLDPALATTRYIDNHRKDLLARATGFVTSDTAPSSQSPATSQIDIPDGQIALQAPMAGLLLNIDVKEGDTVRAGDVIAVIEAMKMEHLVHADRDGIVARVTAEPGMIVDDSHPVALLSPTSDELVDAAALEEIDPDHIRDDLQAVIDRHALTLDTARGDAVAKRHARGLRTARENIDDLIDEGSFREYGALAVAAQRSTQKTDILRQKSPADGIITGLASVNGEDFGSDDAQCAILAVDYTVMAGTQGYFHHKKIDRILHVANEQKLPVIKYVEGGGGRPNDSDPARTVMAGLNISSWVLFGKLAGVAPRIAIVAGRCFAGNAAFAGASDVIIATKDSNLGMGGPAMIEGGGLGSFAPEEVGPSDVQSRNGVIDILVEDEAEATLMAKKYLSYFQGAKQAYAAPDARRLRHILPENRRQVYDMRQVIEGLSDEDSVLELRPNYGTGIITALVRIEGKPFALFANNPYHLGGAIDADGSEKLARFLRICNAHGLPVISLCDTPGFMVGPETEATAQVRRSSQLFDIGANMTVPLFCIIIRKGYGLGAMAMAGGSFALPVFTIAWPTGEVGAMGLEGAVRLGFKKQLEAIEDPAERETMYQTMVDKLYHRGKALNSAEMLEFDAVIDPAETRTWIMQGLDSAT